MSDLGVSKVNFEYRLQTLKGSLIDPFNHQSLDEKKLNTNKKSKNLVDFIGFNIISNALLYNDFYRLDSLKISLPNLKSIKEFIISKEYLKQFNIDIVDSMNKIDSLNSKEKLNIALSFLNLLQNEMKNSILEYEGSKSFKPERFDKVFKNKVLLVPKEKEKKIIKNSDNWFVYKEFYGTSQEKSLIELIGKMIDDIKSKYRQNNIYLIRNERHFKIYNFDDGAAFEPDFVLFLQNQDDDIHFQIFCEPKGKHLVQKDRWKEKFLLDIKNKIKNKIIEFENERYRIFGMKFYESSDENSFEKDLKMELNI